MMAQYRSIKEKYADCILMFRLGDFYEMFFEDAQEASVILQIALTARGKGGDSKTPMCGVPFHAINQYLPKLTKAGKKVAICDQVTVPNGKGIVEREVIRVVTPGTTFDENILDTKLNNYVSAVHRLDKSYGFAFADITTGDFYATEFSSMQELRSELSKLEPAECICEDQLSADQNFKDVFKGISTYLFPFNYVNNADDQLKEHFNLKSLEVFGLFNKTLATVASGMLIQYFKETQKTDLAHIQKISYYQNADFMPLDEPCVRNLELFYTSRSKKEGSLISKIDNTMTSMGGRLIRSWLLKPLKDKENIDARLIKVSAFVKDSSLLRSLRSELKGLFDIERLLSRLSLGTGNARDLIAMKVSLQYVPNVRSLLRKNEEFVEFIEKLHDFTKLTDLIETSINEEAPISVRDSGMIKDGYNCELDELRSLSSEGKGFIKNLQEREIKRTGINSLKVRFNRVFGYYIEISKANLSSVPNDYIRKQTLVNAERYITPELKEYEEKVLNAEDQIKELEYQLFYKVRMEVVKEIVKMQETAKALSELDVYGTFAFNAERNNYCMPFISNDTGIEIKNGRHPVIEQISTSQHFVPNDCEMNEDFRFLLITGPNMGGKSTYLRQVALIVLMAQIGSYVPADSAKIGIVDRIFTRVGASDNMVEGESTFMVEMQETAFILNHATERSLIILDEVGRGTSTYDGVSIAWAITEFIHDRIGAKTIFATHYHELIELIDKLSNAKNMSVAVRENQEEGVVFLYKIINGGVDKSYGIEVAKLAGLHSEIIGRARGVLEDLETKHISKGRINPDQATLFQEARKHAELDTAHKAVMKDLTSLDIDNLTPLQALQKLSEIKKKSG